MCKKRESRAGDIVQLIECLSHMHEALGSSPCAIEGGYGHLKS